MKWKTDRPTGAPMKSYELDMLIGKAETKATRKVAAALHLLAMGRVGWGYTSRDKFASWISCKPKNVAKYLSLAPLIGAQGSITGDQVIVEQIPKASMPYVTVKLPVPIGDKKRLIRHLRRARSNVREAGWQPYARY